MVNSDTIPDDFKKLMQERGIEDEFLCNVIDKNPAALFEIFDSLKVFVGIVIEQLPDTEQAIFKYYICPKGDCLDIPDAPEFNSRKDVEYYAMLAAVEYIDKNLEI